MKIRLFLLAAAVSVSICFICFPALADWQAAFEPPADPSTPLRIDLPADLDVLTLTTLAVELDGTDITPMLALDGEDFVFTPVTPLTAGTHTVRLVVLGNPVREKNVWTFTISESDGASGSHLSSTGTLMADETWLRDGTIEMNTMTELSNRTAEDGLGSVPDHTIASGGGDFNADAQTENWALRARANYLLQSEKDLALTGNVLDLGEYDLSASYEGTRYRGNLTLGHHDIGLDSHLFSGFYRRGASARIGTRNDRIQVTGFAFRPESIAGARNLTGLNDNDNRLEGTSVSIKPFSTGGDALQITGLYYDGQSRTEGVGLAETDTTTDGSGWGTVIEKSFSDQRLTVRGEYAHTTYDADGSSGTAPEDESAAYSLSIEGRPFDDPEFWDKTADIILGARYDHIDTFFQSLANEGLPADRKAFLAYGYIYWGALSGSLQLLHETNNVDDLDNVPTDRLRNATLNLNYYFDPMEDDYRWLGTPYLNFSAFAADLDRLETPAGYSGFDTNNVSGSVTVGGGSNYDNWHWGASHTLSEFEDHANAANDTVNNFTSVNTGWTVNDRLNIDSGLSFGAFRDEDAGDTTYDTTLNIGLDALLVPEKLDLAIDYNLNLSSGSGDQPDRHIVNSEAEYTFFRPRINRPGLAIAVRGAMEDQNDSTNSTDDDTEYQVFTVLRIKAPFGHRF